MSLPKRPTHPVINWGHPLAQDLVFCALFSGQSPESAVDLCKRTPTEGSAGGTTAIGSFGEGRAFDRSSSEWQSWSLAGSPAVGFPTGSGPLSIMGVMNPVMDVCAQNDRFFGITGNNSSPSSATDGAFMWARGSLSDRFVCWVVTNGPYKLTSHDFGANPGWGVFVSTWEGGDNYPSNYFNGTGPLSPGQTATNGTLTSMPGPDGVCVATRANVISRGNYGTLDISLGCLWRRELKHEDALWLYAEPFAFLDEEIQGREYVFLVGSETTFDASDYLENAVLDHTIDGTPMAQPSGVYVSLHSGDTGDTGANEISGGSYARTQASSWAAASGGSKATSGAVVFTGLQATSINGYAIWDAVSGGNCLYTSHPLGTTIVLASGDEMEFGSGNIIVTLD
jgi:hypothetical protein